MKKLTILVASYFAIALLSTNSFAGEAGIDEGQWYFSPMATYVYREDTARITNAGGGLHLGIGRGLSDNWALEINLIGNQLSGSNLHDVSQYGIGIDLINTLNVWEEWSPYWLIGTGYLKSDSKEQGNPPAGIDSDNAMASGGLGLMHNFGESGALFRTEVRYRADFADPDSFGDWLFNIGFSMPMGDSGPKVPDFVDTDGDGVEDGLDLCPGTPAGAMVDSNGCEKDSDRDGVKDSKDDCPNTKRGAKVDSRGCEMKKDSDGDGVYDDKDKCPRTPAGSRVDQFGCVIIGDDDNDGVLNNIDECPNTAANVRVDARGCEIKREIQLPGVEFELNSANLTPDSLRVLKGAAETLQRYTDITVEAQGHTDSTGSDSLNARLSQQRAESVRDYIIGQGVDASRITAKGYGESLPIADNKTADGRQRNRRVTLALTSQ